MELLRSVSHKGRSHFMIDHAEGATSRTSSNRGRDIPSIIGDFTHRIRGLWLMVRQSIEQGVSSTVLAIIGGLATAGIIAVVTLQYSNGLAIGHLQDQLGFMADRMGEMKQDISEMKRDIRSGGRGQQQP